MKRLETLDCVRIVLLRPSEPGNVGSVARAMTNLGFSRLVLVPGKTPATELVAGDARKFAAGADRVLEDAVVAGDLAAALSLSTFAVGTTARPRARLEVQNVEDLPPMITPRIEAGEAVSLVFGPEDKGLSNEELNLCQTWVTVPTSPEHTSLNLAQAVLLLCYETSRALRRQLVQDGEAAPEPASAGEREAMYRQMREILLRIGYLNPDAPGHIEGDLRRLIDRARPTTREVTLLRGIWSQMNWAAFRTPEED